MYDQGTERLKSVKAFQGIRCKSKFKLPCLEEGGEGAGWGKKKEVIRLIILNLDVCFWSQSLNHVTSTPKGRKHWNGAHSMG